MKPENRKLFQQYYHLNIVVQFWVQISDLYHCTVNSKMVPSKHLLVLQTSWKRLQDMFWRRLKDIFRVTIFFLPRRLQDVLKTSGRRFTKMFWKAKNCYVEHVFTTSWRHFLKTSSRCLGDKQNVYWGYLYLRNLYFTNLYLTN